MAITVMKIKTSVIIITVLLFLTGCGKKPAIQEPVRLTIDQANNLAELPLACLQNEYPNKPGQTLGTKEDIKEPHGLHPAFYGCFDWHSAVHGHWSLVKLLKEFPLLNNAGLIRLKLRENISSENVRKEVAYFRVEYNKTYERTYGWAWLLKLAEELHTWDDPLARELENNLQPLTDIIVQKYIDFLPRLNYPVRVGEHENTAFGLSFAWDYANTTGHKELKSVIESRAKEFYFNDANCPLDWEPGGYDFLSPCFEEIDLMRRVLNKDEFGRWINNFAPQLKSKDFEIETGEVSDRTDGKLVHLDGLNFSRAWVLYGLAAQYPEYRHLVNIANEHVRYSLPNLMDDTYEGGHWLGSFAIYALGNIQAPADPEQEYKAYAPKESDRVISRAGYMDKMYGFWLGQCIANWTGLVTEMDKIGNIGEIKTGDFYTRSDWGKPDQPSIWGGGKPSDISPTIDFVFEDEGGVWGADDDTDIEYMYQHLLYTNKTSVLTGRQIRDGWLKHIKADEENFLWVSNQKAFDLMKKGLVPPQTSDPDRNPDYEMIDAQLTTEIFGLFAPCRPDIALKMAYLPIRTTARENAAWISEFYVIMHSLASCVDENMSMKDKILWMADMARQRLLDNSYSAGMYDFVKARYIAGVPWEQVRDEIYLRYQVNQEDGYNITSRGMECNGCFAAGINFASSIVSLLYGEGDIKETIKIGTLAGWDSDNPTATWGGLLGFMIGREGVETAFNRKFAEKYNIHRTRQNFPGNGIDTFSEMARRGIYIIDRVVQEEMGGGVDLQNNIWYIPDSGLNIAPAE